MTVFHSALILIVSTAIHLRASHAETIEIRRVASVYASPDKNAEVIGKIASRTRVQVLETKRKRGCSSKWRKIEPNGWICTKTKPTSLKVTTAHLPRLKAGVLPVGRFGRVSKKDGVLIYKNVDAILSGQGVPPTRPMSVLRKRSRKIDGKSYWATSNGLIERRFIRKYKLSDYKGETLDGSLAFPFAWARPAERRADVLVYQSPTLDAQIVARLPPKTQVPYLGESANGAFVQIGNAQWILRGESRKAERREPPSEVRSDEVWIDVNLQEQVLMVYVGKSPVYATMVSTGTRKHRTPPGKYRIQRKVAQKTMASGESESEQYSVGGVPWIMYVHKTYALHGAYWHDRMGAPRSHGCINLSPKDAQHIYGLVQPQVPAGWLSANATEDQPGTLVHIRSAQKPEASARIRY